MSTAVLERPDVDMTDTNDPSKVAHYVRRKKIVDSLVFGNELEALCGHIFIPSRLEDRLPVCAPCKEIFEDDNRRGVTQI